MSEGLEEKKQRQTDRVTEATEEMKKLGELGFVEADIPEDISEDMVSCLKMQRLCAEGNYDELHPMMYKSLQTLKVPADVMRAFTSLNQAENLDAEVKSDIVNRVIFWLSDAYKEKAKRFKPKETL
jgi:hypothetical protein